MLTTAGLQVPLIPLSEVAGKTGAVLPLQRLSEVPKLNVGVRIGLTVTVKAATPIHWPGTGSGVKV